MTSSFDAIRERAADAQGRDRGSAAAAGAGAGRAAPRKPARSPHPVGDGRARLRAGFVWRVIEQKWPGFRGGLPRLRAEALLFQPDDFWHELTRDKRIVRNPQKIRSVRDNAVFVDGVAREHGSFGAFLAAWPADDQIGLIDLSRQARQPARRRDRAVLPALSRLGHVSWWAETWRGRCAKQASTLPSRRRRSATCASIQDQINAWAEETGLSRQHISRILALSTGVNNPPEALLEPDRRVTRWRKRTALRAEMRRAKPMP